MSLLRHLWFCALGACLYAVLFFCATQLQGCAVGEEDASLPQVHVADVFAPDEFAPTLPDASWPDSHDRTAPLSDHQPLAMDASRGTAFILDAVSGASDLDGGSVAFPDPRDVILISNDMVHTADVTGRDSGTEIVAGPDSGRERVVDATDSATAPDASRPDTASSVPDVRELPDTGVSPPFPSPPDAGRADGCHDLVIRPDTARLPVCRAGWVLILYDNEGHPHESAPSGPLNITLCGRLRGQLIVSARCGGEYLLDWPARAGRPAREGGLVSITLDGEELADSESLTCFDRWSPTPGIRPVIPLERFYHGRCP